MGIGAGIAAILAVFLDHIKRKNEMELIYPDTGTFALKKGQGVELKMPSGDEEPFAMGRLYAVNSYAYVGIDDKNGKLKIGEKLEFGPEDDACYVQLASINAGRAEGIFIFDCERSVPSPTPPRRPDATEKLRLKRTTRSR